MLWEVLAAALLGAAILWLALRPLLAAPAPPPLEEPAPLEETPRGRALLALKEIEFDRATGKLSEPDYHELKTRYTAQALAVLRAEPDPEALITARLRVIRAGGAEGPVCAACGPRPEADARFCSSCGMLLVAAAVCSSCGAHLEAAGRFCASCGTAVAA